MPRLVYRETSTPVARKWVELEDVHDGDTLTDIQALIVTLKDMDTSLEMIVRAINDATP